MTTLHSGGAAARTEGASPYNQARTYSGAVRYLRVDMNYEIVERDVEAGYLLFRFVPQAGGKLTRGSIEVVTSRGNTKIVVQLPDLPSYREAMIRDGLLAKLRRDYGDPPEKRPEQDKERDRDKAKDKAKDKDKSKGDGSDKDKGRGDSKDKGRGDGDRKKRGDDDRKSGEDH